jgi:hypothetical protein
MKANEGCKIALQYDKPALFQCYFTSKEYAFSSATTNVLLMYVSVTSTELLIGRMAHHQDSTYSSLSENADNRSSLSTKVIDQVPSQFS